MSTRPNQLRQATLAIALIVVPPGVTPAGQVRLASYQEGSNGSATGLGRHSSSGTGLSRDQATAPLVASLQLVIAKLHQAGLSDDGHRMKAIEHLDQAIWTLQPNLAGVRIGVGATSTIKGSRTIQAQSLASLRQAHQQLRVVESRMIGRGGNGPTYHRQAHTHVQRAIQELDVALAAR